VRKKLLAVVMAVLVFGLIAASAASLGGINTADLGADSVVVAACDTDGVDVDYNYTYNSGAPGYFEMTSVDVSSIAAGCDNYAIHVTLGDDGTLGELGTGDVADIGATGTINVAISAGVDAEAVEEIGIVISG